MTTTTEPIVDQFQMHPKLLYDVIRRQAGTLEKALLEAAMNAVDAQASRVVIQATGERVTISDDGRGFQTIDGIQTHFRVFGQPHEQSEGKIYGTFRMGRGQLFASGKNRWQSNRFEMSVDVEGRGLDFDLLTDRPQVDGCTITIDLYNPLLPSALVALERDLERMVRYFQIPVLFNGRSLSKPPAEEKWDMETEDAYIRFRSAGSLEVYNLGAHVTSIWSGKFGAAGVVVSKAPLQINFARNDVHDSPAWRRITALLREHAGTTIERKNNRLDDSQRDFLAQQIRANGRYDGKGPQNLALFTDVTGRHWSGNKIANHLARKRISVVSNAPAGDLRGDTIMQQQSAFVFSDTTLDRFQVETLDELLDLMYRAYLWAPTPRPRIVDFEDLAQGISAHYAIVPDSNWTAVERAVMRALDEGMRTMHAHDHTPRKLLLGESTTALGWTDGESYIALRRQVVREANSYEGMLRAAIILMHEMTHGEPTEDTHDHTPEFYRDFHDEFVLSSVLVNFLSASLAALPKELEREGRRLGQKQLKIADRATRIDRANEQIETAERQIAALQEPPTPAEPSDGAAPSQELTLGL